MKIPSPYIINKNRNKYLITVLVFLFYNGSFFAQSFDTIPPSSQQITTLSSPNSDTIPTKISKHPPMRALLFSAVLPGLGQAYNKKYWKIPIIYAGLGGLGYLIYYENNRYQGYRKAYIMQVDGNPYTQGIYGGTSNASTLEIGKNYYRRNLDLACVGLFVWYALNLVDATVDAHLFKFDVSDNLSMNWQPDFQFSAMNGFKTSSFGLKLQVKL